MSSAVRWNSNSKLVEVVLVEKQHLLSKIIRKYGVDESDVQGERRN